MLCGKVQLNFRRRICNLLEALNLFAMKRLFFTLAFGGFFFSPVFMHAAKVNNLIYGIVHSPLVPNSTQTVNICAEICNGVPIASAEIWYATDTVNTTYSSVPMTYVSGITWCGDLPAFPDGTFIKYYICAEDSNAQSQCSPLVPQASDPKFFRVRDNGLTIYDVQFVPSWFNSDRSGYVDKEVTVEGVVSASAEPGNLGSVYIQQEGISRFAGLWVLDHPALAGLAVGNKVSVTGSIDEYFGFTRMENISAVSVIGSGNIVPVSLSPDPFTNQSLSFTEAYESMLVRFSGSNGKVYVVDENADAPNNFGEYRIGEDLAFSTIGCRVLAGRQSSATFAFSSLNVSYVNDSIWATQEGTMNVPVILVETGDEFCSVTGVLHYSFGAIKLLPRNNADFDTSSCFTGIDWADISEPLVYPNPASEWANIVIPGESANGGISVEIYDLRGKMLAFEEFAAAEKSYFFRTDDFSAGSYFLIVKRNDGKRLYAKKLLIAAY